MPKISELDAETTPANNDLLPIVDIAGVITKKITRDDLFTGTPLPADTVDGQAIADDSVTADKSEELAKATERQFNNSSAVVLDDPIIKFGGMQTTATTAKTTTLDIAFTTAFDNNPIVTVSVAGYKSGGATDINTGQALTSDGVIAYAENISTTGFRFRFIAVSANLPNVALIGTWTAVGIKAR